MLDTGVMRYKSVPCLQVKEMYKQIITMQCNCCCTKDAHKSFRSRPKWSQGDQSHPRYQGTVENLRGQPFSLNHRHRFNLQPWHDISGKYTVPFYLTCKSRVFQNITPTSPSVEPFLSPHSFSNTWLLDQLLVFSKLHSFLSFLTFFHRPILFIPIRSNSQRAYIYREPANHEKHMYFLLRKVSPYFRLLTNSMSHVVCKKRLFLG